MEELWFLYRFELQKGSVRLVNQPTANWRSIGSRVLRNGDLIRDIVKQSGLNEPDVQACLGLYVWTIQNPGVDPCTLFDPRESDPAPAEQPSEFARAVATRLAGWKGYDQGDSVSEEDAERYLTQEFVGAYNSMTWENLADLAAICEQLAIDRGLKPEGNP